MVPTGLDEFLAEHTVGDTVTGRIIDIDRAANTARVELGEGIIAPCTIPPEAAVDAPATVDFSQLGALLSSKWKTAEASAKPAPKKSAPTALAPGQIRSFRLLTLDPDTKKLTLELA